MDGGGGEGCGGCAGLEEGLERVPEGSGGFWVRCWRRGERERSWEGVEGVGG